MSDYCWYVWQVSAVDDDVGDDVTYHLEGPLYDDDPTRFSIDDDGNIYLLDALDRDAPGGYNPWTISGMLCQIFNVLTI